MPRIKFLSIIFSVWIFIGCTAHRNSYEKVLLSHPVRSELFHIELIYADQFKEKPSLFENTFRQSGDHVPEFNFACYKNKELSWLAVTQNEGKSASRYFGVIDMTLRELIEYLRGSPNLDELFLMNTLNFGRTTGYASWYSFLLREENDVYIPVELYCVNASMAYPFDDSRLYEEMLDEAVLSVLKIRKKIYIKKE